MNRLVVVIPCSLAVMALLAGTAAATEKVKVKAEATVEVKKTAADRAAARKAALKKVAAQQAEAKFACMTTAECTPARTGYRNTCHLSPDGTAGRCGPPIGSRTRTLPSQILIINQNNFLILCCQDHIQSCCPESDYDGN